MRPKTSTLHPLLILLAVAMASVLFIVSCGGGEEATEVAQVPEVVEEAEIAQAPEVVDEAEGAAAELAATEEAAEAATEAAEAAAELAQAPRGGDAEKGRHTDDGDGGRLRVPGPPPWFGHKLTRPSPRHSMTTCSCSSRTAA